MMVISQSVCGLVGRAAGWNEQNSVQMESPGGRFGRFHMACVNWIESPAKNSNFHAVVSPDGGWASAEISTGKSGLERERSPKPEIVNKGPETKHPTFGI